MKNIRLIALAAFMMLGTRMQAQNKVDPWPHYIAASLTISMGAP